MKKLALLIPFLLSACVIQTGPVEPEEDTDTTPEVAIYQLVELYGRPFLPNANVRFESDDRLAGDSPCNLWTSNQVARYPGFDVENLIATKRVCDDMSEETAFFSALSTANRQSLSNGVLILTDDRGRRMVFRELAR